MSFNKRIDLFKQKLSEQNLDGAYIINLTNVRYLTGFTGSAGSLLILDNKQFLQAMIEYKKSCVLAESKDELKPPVSNYIGVLRVLRLLQIELMYYLKDQEQDY